MPIPVRGEGERLSIWSFDAHARSGDDPPDGGKAQAETRGNGGDPRIRIRGRGKQQFIIVTAGQRGGEFRRLDRHR